MDYSSFPKTVHSTVIYCKITWNIQSDHSFSFRVKELTVNQLLQSLTVKILIIIYSLHLLRALHTEQLNYCAFTINLHFAASLKVTHVISKHPLLLKNKDYIVVDNCCQCVHLSTRIIGLDRKGAMVIRFIACTQLGLNQQPSNN